MNQSRSGGFSVPSQSGFTLLEVLLAIGITAMIGLGSWQILNGAIRASEATQARLADLNLLQKTMLILSRDFQQVLPRSIRDEYGDYQPALTSKTEFYLIEFSRNGWRNPMDDARSNIQRVAYEFVENKLVRHYWQVLDRSQDSQPVSKTLLENVNSVNLRFMNDSGSWLDQWPPSESGNTPGNEAQAAKSDPRRNENQLPKAVEISFDLVQFGKIKRLYHLVSYLEGVEIAVTNNNPDNPDDNVNPNGNTENREDDVEVE
jgi:general secretion pathway protein J